MGRERLIENFDINGRRIKEQGPPLTPAILVKILLVIAAVLAVQIILGFTVFKPGRAPDCSIEDCSGLGEFPN